MIKIKNCFCLLLSCLLLFSCQSNEQKMIKQIDSLEKEISSNEFIPDRNTAIKLIELYDEFSEKYPELEQTPEYLFKAGSLCMSVNMSAEALGFFDKIINTYPNYSKHPDSYFLKAFVYDSQLNNLPLARQSYEALIEKYPEHDLAEQARQLIPLLGKNLEDIINGFEKENNDSLVLK